jgi:hypothetical protein
MADENSMQRMERERRERKEWRNQEKQAEKRIAELGQQYPSLRDRFAEIIRQQRATRTHYTIQDILYRIEREIEAKSPPPQSN